MEIASVSGLRNLSSFFLPFTLSHLLHVHVKVAGDLYTSRFCFKQSVIVESHRGYLYTQLKAYTYTLYTYFIESVVEDSLINHYDLWVHSKTYKEIDTVLDRFNFFSLSLRSILLESNMMKRGVSISFLISVGKRSWTAAISSFMIFSAINSSRNRSGNAHCHRFAVSYSR